MANEKPKCELVGKNGNIFNLLHIASRTLKEHGQREQAKAMCDRVQTEAKSYDEALCIIMDFVDVC